MYMLTLGVQYDRVNRCAPGSCCSVMKFCSSCPHREASCFFVKHSSHQVYINREDIEQFALSVPLYVQFYISSQPTFMLAPAETVGEEEIVGKLWFVFCAYVF